MSLPYYKKYSKDFLEGTAHMSGELKGAYSVLLDLIYVQNGQCPDNAHYVSGNLGYSVRKWNSIKKELIKLGKIEVKDGIINAIIFSRWDRIKRPAIPSDISKAVYSRDGNQCVYCGDIDGPFHLDHIYPWSLGGEHTLDNLAVSCAICNLSKGSKTLDQWEGIVQ